MDIDLARGLVWFLVFLFSTTVHEAMHALVAWKGGDPTAYLGGQVSLSPVPHVRREPFTQGWVMGWASAPYDPRWAERYPRRAALMAAAGPAGNFLIALVALVALKAGLVLGWFVAPDRASFDTLVATASGGGAGFAGTLLSVTLVLNVFLGVFNMLPLPPLDGGAVIRIFLPEGVANQLRGLESTGAMSMIGLVVAWQIFPMLTSPLFGLVLRLVHPGAFYS
jgi:Zn-dependent protease